MNTCFYISFLQFTVFIKYKGGRFSALLLVFCSLLLLFPDKQKFLHPVKSVNGSHLFDVWPPKPGCICYHGFNQHCRSPMHHVWLPPHVFLQVWLASISASSTFLFILFWCQFQVNLGFSITSRDLTSPDIVSFHLKIVGF